MFYRNEGLTHSPFGDISFSCVSRVSPRQLLPNLVSAFSAQQLFRLLSQHSSVANNLAALRVILTRAYSNQSHLRAFRAPQEIAVARVAYESTRLGENQSLFARVA